MLAVLPPVVTSSTSRNAAVYGATRGNASFSMPRTSAFAGADFAR